VHYGRVQPAIDPVLTSLNASYWSSTTYAGNPAAAWALDAINGQLTAAAKDRAHYVRAVRNAQ